MIPDTAPDEIREIAQRVRQENFRAVKLVLYEAGGIILTVGSAALALGTDDNFKVLNDAYISTKGLGLLALVWTSSFTALAHLSGSQRMSEVSSLRTALANHIISSGHVQLDRPTDNNTSS